MVYTFLYSLGWLAAGTRLFVLLAGVGMLKWVEAGEGGGGGKHWVTTCGRHSMVTTSTSDGMLHHGG